MANRFEKLAAINCSDKIEKKGRLSYLSWAWAWDQFKRVFPDSFFTVYEAPDGCFYFTDGRTCWVKTGVTLVDGDYSLELIERLPIMDNRNESIPLERVTSRNVNDSIQRSLTKAVARHGLGLYVYAGEDIPEGAEVDIKATPVTTAPPQERPAPARAAVTVDLICGECGNPIQDIQKRDGATWFASDIAAYTKKRYGKCLCGKCALDAKKAAG